MSMLAHGLYGYASDYAVMWILFLSLIAHAAFFFRFFPRDRHRRIGLIAGNLLVFFCLLGAVGLAGETYYRFIRVDLDPFGVSLPSQRWFARYVSLNSGGYRDAEWTKIKPAGVKRIAFIGDSFAYGWGIENVADRYTNLIAAKWSTRSPGSIEIMNVAKPGWDTAAHARAAFEMIDQYDVDEIVLCYVPNDIERLLPRSHDFDPINPPEPKWFSVESSALADHLYRAIFVPRAPTVHRYHDWLAKGYEDAAIWRLQKEQLVAILQLCRQRGVMFRAVLHPFLRTGSGDYDSNEIHALLRTFFQEQGVPFVDLFPVTHSMNPEELTVNRWDAHPNETANALYAADIWRAFFDAAEN